MKNPYKEADSIADSTDRDINEYVQAMLNKSKDNVTLHDDMSVFVFDEETNIATLRKKIEGVQKKDIDITYYEPQPSSFNGSEVAFKIEYPNCPEDLFGVGFEYNSIYGSIKDIDISFIDSVLEIKIYFDKIERKKRKLIIP